MTHRGSWGQNQGMTFESNSVDENNDYYPEDAVDWVLVSLRSQVDVEYENMRKTRTAS